MNLSLSLLSDCHGCRTDGIRDSATEHCTSILLSNVAVLCVEHWRGVVFGQNMQRREGSPERAAEPRIGIAMVALVPSTRKDQEVEC